MATNAVIGALRVVLGADTAALDKGLADARKRLDAFGASMARAGTAAAVAFGAATVALGVSIKRAIDEADNLGKMSQKIGIPVEELSALKHAADLSGVSMESMGKALGKLSKAMVDAAANPAGDAAKAFKSVGVSVQDSDGKLKSSSTVMTEIAGKYENLKDGAGKTANSFALLGKAGADLIPLLNGGAAGISAMTKEAAELGIVIDSQTSKSAEAFNDNLTRLGKVWDGLILKITAQMLPALQQFSQIMIDGAKNADLIKQVADGIVTALKGVVSFVVQTVVVFQRLGAEITALVGALKIFKTQAEANEAWAKFRAEGEKTKQTFADMNTFVQRFWSDADAGAKAVAPEIKKNLGEINIAALANKNALEKFLESQQKSIVGHQAEAMAVGLAVGAKERLKLSMEAYQIAATEGIRVTPQLAMQIAQMGIAAEQAALKMNGATLINQSIPAWQVYEMEIARANASLTAFGATAEQKAMVLERIAERAGATWGQAGASIAGSFKDISTAFGKESSSMAAAAKVFSVIQATISMFTGAAKALELPFPANLAAMASVLATGAGLVAQIKSQSVPGMSTGGAITVPGGVGGGDRVRAMVDLEPGEQVDVWRPGQRGGDPRRGAGGQINIALQGDNYSRSGVEKLISAINDAIGDGHRLKVAAA
jgi:hypothetical protein